MANYEPAENIEEMAESLIGRFYEHLESAEIRWYFKTYDKERSQKGRDPKPGKARKVYSVQVPQLLIRDASGIHFVVAINEQYWDSIDTDQQQAVLDEILASLGWDEGEPYRKDPDIVGFSTVMERRGLYTPELKSAIEQLNLPLSA